MARRDFVLVCSSDLAAESRQVLLATGFLKLPGELVWIWMLGKLRSSVLELCNLHGRLAGVYCRASLALLAHR